MARDHLRGIKRAIDELNGAGIGAELVVSYHRPDLLTTGPMVVARRHVEEGARERAAAVDGTVTRQPILPTWPDQALSAHGSFAVLLAAPFEDDRARAASGRTGRWLRSQLAGAGADPSSVAYLTLVGEQLGSTPTDDDLRQWRQWALDAILAANVRYLLLLGAQPVAAWRNDVALSQMSWNRSMTGLGLWHVKGLASAMGRTAQMLVGVLPSPLSVMRDRAMTEDWQRGMARWVAAVKERREIPGDALGERCAYRRCGETAWAYDGDAVPWCRNHWNPDGRAKTDSKWINKHEGQGELL